jgi:hypothetical protein
MLTSEQISGMTDEQLRSLNTRLVAEIRHRIALRTQQAALQWRPGQTALFKDGRGITRTIRINAINRKTVSGVELTPAPGAKWRVGPGLLRRPVVSAVAA